MSGLSDAERAAEHLWLDGVRRDPAGEVRFLPSDPTRGMSGTWAGQVTDSIDAMLSAARAEGAAGVLAEVEALADRLLPPYNCELRPDGSEDPQLAAWVQGRFEAVTDLRAILARHAEGGEG